GNPTILATLAVIAAILPMGFVRGLMGPYMRPIPVGASAAMLFSLAIAFIVTPWAAVRLLKSVPEGAHHAESWSTRMYRRVMGRIIGDPRVRWGFLGGVALLLLAAVSLVALKVVRVKMLPFDNKSEVQIVVDMPEGTTLERTAAATGARIKVAEVPPGPPVLQTLVAEIYGPDYARQIAVAKDVERVFAATPGVVDVDSYIEDDQQQFRFVVDREKASLSGVSQEQIDATLHLALSGMNVGLLHQ